MLKGLEYGLEERFGKNPVHEGESRLDLDASQDPVNSEKIKLAKNEFEDLLYFMNNFEKKYFNEFGNPGIKEADKTSEFTMENTYDILFKRMRALENRFYRNYDRYFDLGHPYSNEAPERVFPGEEKEQSRDTRESRENIDS